MKINSFFCGAGGFDLGFIQAGFEVAGAWDFDKYAVESYKHNIGDHVKEMSVLDMKGEDVPKANGWLFGFPCQDISVAGKQAGMVKGETRSGLFYEIMRLLGEVSDKPEWILAENVKAVNKFIPTIREEYERAGYKIIDPKLYNSKFWWVPQNRERYFLMGVREDVNVDFIFPTQQTEFTPKLSSVLESEVDEKYYISDEKAAKIIEQAMERIELKQTHPCITPDRVDKRQNGRRAKDNEEEMFTLTAQDLHGVIIDPSQEKREGKYRIYDEQGPTLTTSEGGHRQPKILEKYRVRKLTPREYARLQGFPDSYEQVVSNSQFYKQMGNAVTVNVAHAIAKAIKEQFQ